MDAYDPYNDYPEYGPTMSGVMSSAHEDSKLAKDRDHAADDELLADILTPADSRRIGELSLEDYPVRDGYGKRFAARVRSSAIPATAVHADSLRMSLHPLGEIGRPAGFSPRLWTALDRDGLLKAPFEADVHALDSHMTTRRVTGEAGEDTDVSTTEEAVTVTGGAGGGGGGDITTSEKEEDGLDPTEMPFLDHLEEFRWALLKSIFAVAIGMLLSWFFAEEFINTITRLAIQANFQVIITKVMESFMLRLETAFFMGIVIALPFVFYFVWQFVSPGLYKHERIWILPTVIGATICFFIGASIAYFLVIPFMLKFLKGFGFSGVSEMLTIGDLIKRLLQFTAVFGLIFEMPMVALVLAKIGILKHTWMAQYRKYAIVTIFILGAVLTPPDPFSQIMMAVPLILLYEISIQVARLAGKKSII